MTIDLAIQEHGENKKVSVTAYLPFEMFGYTFAAHKEYGLKDTWNVSEVTTGFAVCRNNYTRKGAIDKAIIRMEGIGKVKVIEAIEYCKTLI